MFDVALNNSMVWNYRFNKAGQPTFQANAQSFHFVLKIRIDEQEWVCIV